MTYFYFDWPFIQLIVVLAFVLGNLAGFWMGCEVEAEEWRKKYAKQKQARTERQKK